MKKMFKKIFVFFSLILSIYLIFNIYNLNVFPIKYFYIITSAVILLNLIAMFNFLSKKIFQRFIGKLLYLLIIVICVLGLKYTSETISFLNESFSSLDEQIEYDIVVLKSSNYKELSSLSNKSLGYIENDSNNNKVLEKLKSKVKTNDLKFNNINEMYNDLDNKKIQSLVAPESLIDLLEEDNYSVKDNIKVIYKFKISTKENSSDKKLTTLKPVNIYISGSDSRGEISDRSRSDVNMILTLNPKTNKILLTNIPRDYYVKLHNTTGLNDKLTHAGIYGTEMSKTTLEDLFNIDISSTIKVGFQSVIKIVDLVGGIDIYSDQELTTSGSDGGATPVHIVVGNNHLTGAEALSFARERHAYTKGDRQRGENQQLVLEALINKLTKDKTMLLKYNEFLENLKTSYKTDISEEFIKNLVRYQLDDMPSWTIEKQEVDGTGSYAQTYSIPGRNLYVMIPNTDSVTKATKKINKVLDED